MNDAALPSRDEMVKAFLSGDATYDGLFYTAVRSTGIFCRPACPARKPRPENVRFYASAREALAAGYRPCLRCRPMEPAGTPPGWLAGLLAEVEADPARRLTSADLRARGLSPDRVRRWFVARHGMTFQAYARARRLGLALGRIREGEEVTAAAFDHGYQSLSGFHEAFRKVLGVPPGVARAGPVVAVRRLPTPLGEMVAAATDAGLCLLEFAERRMLETQVRRVARAIPGASFVPGTHAHLDLLAAELERYFAGALRAFTVPVHAPGTPFQEAVWTALRAVPYGTTTTYLAQARAIGRPEAVRAVARANGDNRVAVVVPCHRVIGAGGELVGYGGGLWRKKRLLELEARAGGHLA